MNYIVYQSHIDEQLSDRIALGTKGIIGPVNFSEDLAYFLLQRNITFSSKNEAYTFFDELYKNRVSHLEEQISVFNYKVILEEMIVFLKPLVRLSISKLNGKLDFQKEKYNFPKIYQTLKTIDNKDELAVRTLFTTLHAYVGIKKRAVDVLANLCLIKVAEDNVTSSERKVAPEDILYFLELSNEIAYLFELFQMISKEKNFSVNTVSINDGHIVYQNSTDFTVELATNTAFKDFTYPVNQEEMENIYNLYKDEFGFSPQAIYNTFDLLFKNIPNDSFIFHKSKDELRGMLALNRGTMTLNGLLTLLEKDLCLEYKSQDKHEFIFDYKNKLSRKGLVKIREEYIFSTCTIASYINHLGNDLLNQDFLSRNKLPSPKISSYLSNFYAEKWLDDLSQKLMDKGIWNKIQVDSFEQEYTFPFNGTTKEIDFILFDDKRKVLILGEYKNWKDVSHYFTEVEKEKNKINKMITSHVNLLKVLESDKSKLSKILEIDVRDAKLELINVFEERNILCNDGLNGNRQDGFCIRNFSREDFERYLEKNGSNFLTIK